MLTLFLLATQANNVESCLSGVKRIIYAICGSWWKMEDSSLHYNIESAFSGVVSNRPKLRAYVIWDAHSANSL